MTFRWTLKRKGLKDGEEKLRTNPNGWMSLGRLRSSYMDCNTTEEEVNISTKF